ncbi:helix-hairpin-helix domain-containing protein [Variovorax humicola]|uniref:Helix-hairpin-helix domain-containing protein n=1 Tax=Variovorax humicola TaxID=1769758 RepID=A0ABU8VT99_9BURK
MFRKFAAALAATLFAVSSFAAVEANKGTAAELDGLKGVGPAMSKRIVDARAQGEFKDWADFMSRVKGVKDKSAAKLSNEGLTINGQGFTPVAQGEGKKKHSKNAASEPAAASATPPAVASPAAVAATPAAAPAAPAATATTRAAAAAKPAVVPVVVPAAAQAVAPAAAPAAKAAAAK